MPEKSDVSLTQLLHISHHEEIFCAEEPLYTLLRCTFNLYRYWSFPLVSKDGQFRINSLWSDKLLRLRITASICAR